MFSELFDMDTQEKIRYVNESSNTSGYSTMSSVSQTFGNTSPTSSAHSVSSAHSPVTAALQTEFSNLNLPANSPIPIHHYQHNRLQQHNPPHYSQLVKVENMQQSGTYIDMDTSYMSAANTSNLSQFGGETQQQHAMYLNQNASAPLSPMQSQHKYTAKLEILEQPVEKFRFRYKSEMHGTHGSLNGANSKRTPRTYPEVRLCNYDGPAVIHCSLFQTNLDSPHSHQLVVRTEEKDKCDPHILNASPEVGWVAQFQNMGIIHTAKKFIYGELLEKKKNRLLLQLRRRELTTKENQELCRETEREAKDMNLNQVRLCFEAYKKNDDHTFTLIAAPVFSNPINNRKSAQTGELRITRLSIATGSVSGSDELILLVEKVSKKNIKVRFYEQNEDDETIWEAYGKFRESDVHHQYAIVCQTPPYKNKDIDKPVEICIELVRPSDDERSYPPLPFRYKPRETIAARKRRRTCSTATSSSGTNSASSSIELPKPVEEQVAALPSITNCGYPQTISEEFKRSDILKLVEENSDELSKLFPDIESMSFGFSGILERDGAGATNSQQTVSPNQNPKVPIASGNSDLSKNKYLDRMFKIYDDMRSGKMNQSNSCKQIEDLFIEHADSDLNGDSLLHEIIANPIENNLKIVLKTFQIFNFLKLHELVNHATNHCNQSAVHYACLYNRPMYIRPLLGLGCDPNMQDHIGNTALHVAVEEGHQSCIDSFLNWESNPKINFALKNDEGFTPLHLAIRQNNYILAKKLLKNDITALNICNSKDGNTPLHMAVQQQNLELVILILDAQPFENIIGVRNNGGHTAFDLAKQMDSRSNNKIVQFLASLYKDTSMVIENHAIDIKEEDMSSSSTDIDDDTSNEPIDEQKQLQLTLQRNQIEIKEENNVALYDTDMHIDGNESNFIRDAQNFEIDAILNDTRKFKKLVELLDQSNGKTQKWKHLAEKSKMQHLVFLWSNAEGMLNYVKTKSSDIEYRLFASALAEVDLDALRVLQTN